MSLRVWTVLTIGTMALAAGAQAFAAPPPPGPPAPAAPGASAAPAAAPDPALAFYPPAARAAGVEGQAIIRCGRDTHLKLQGCVLVSEIPAGQGFGAAALAMAGANQSNPKVTTTDASVTAPKEMLVRFSLHPPRVDPDLTQVAHIVMPARLLAAPTHDQITAAYPARALADQIQGVAGLDCMVSVEGKLSGCRVLGERPPGYGFGAAALDLVGDFKLQPRTLDGDPVAAEVNLPVPFRLTDPNAPLTLTPAPRESAPTPDPQPYEAPPAPGSSPPPML